MALDLPADAVLFLCPEDRMQKRKTRARMSCIEFRHSGRECQAYALITENYMEGCAMTMNMNNRNNRAIIFKDQEHEAFYMNGLQRCKCQDANHKALIYCLGISGDTRQCVERIYDFDNDSVKTECLGEGWITSGSARIVRMAFNLFCNGTPSAYDLEGEEKVRECQRYTVEDLFCCEYAVYFLEAVKVRYPEYCFPVDLSAFGM